MERLILLSGDGKYIPFARSQIKALRAAGLIYAQRRWVMPDGEVGIKIVAEIEYIYLSSAGCVLPMDSGVVEGYSIGASGYLAVPLMETASVASYNANFTDTIPVSEWRTNKNDTNTGQLSGTVSASKTTVRGRVPYDNQTARSFAPGKVNNSDVPPQEIDNPADVNLLAKKLIATTCPASIFTGRCRLYIQALYGQHLYLNESIAATATVLPTLTGNPTPALQIPSRYSASTLITVTTSTGVYLDPLTGKHWLLKPNGSAVLVYPLIANACGEALRPLLIPGSGLNEADRERLEAYILSSCKPDAAAVQTASGSAISVTAYAMGYGWHWNWTGDTADIVTTGSEVMSLGEFPKQISTHYRMSATRTTVDGVTTWAVSVSTVEGPKTWAIERLNWCIAEPLWSNRTLVKSTPKYAQIHACDAPFYCFYNRNELKVCRVRVVARAATPDTHEWDPPTFTDAANVSNTNSYNTLGLLSGYLETSSGTLGVLYNGGQWVGEFSVGSERIEDLYLGRQEAGNRVDIKDKVMPGDSDSGFAPDYYGYTFGQYYTFEYGYPRANGTYAMDEWRCIPYTGFQMYIQYVYETSNITHDYSSQATLIIPFNDAEAVFMQGRVTQTDTRSSIVRERWESLVNSWAIKSRPQREGALAGGPEIRLDSRDPAGALDWNWVGPDYIKYRWHQHGASNYNALVGTNNPPTEVTTTTLLDYKKLICRAGAVDAIFASLEPFHNNSDQYEEISDVYLCHSGVKTDLPTVHAADRITPIGFNGHSASSPILLGWI